MPMHSTTDRFTGIWRSDYTYHSSDRDELLLAQNYVRIFPKGNEIIIESIPELNDSYLLARFTVDGNIATGSWQKVSNPEGAYKGALYYGAAQLIIADDQKSFKGKWVGFGKNMEVKSGPWTFVYVGKDTSEIKKHPKIVNQ